MRQQDDAAHMRDADITQQLTNSTAIYVKVFSVTCMSLTEKTGVLGGI